VRGVALPPTVCAIGEVSLSGDVRSVPGLDRRLAEAARLGMTTALVPAGYRERLTNDMVTRPVATIGAALSAAGALAAGVAPGPDPIRARAGPPDPPADADALGRRRGPSKRR
jgi:DNA repair protein RadA/Sms